MAIFPGGPGFWILLELRMMEVVVTAGAIRYGKLQSNHHYHRTNSQFLQAGCPSCHPASSVRALKGAARHMRLDGKNGWK